MSHVASPQELAHCDLTSDEQATYEERAAIIEFDGGLPRAEAEALALKQVLGERRVGSGCVDGG